MLRANGRRYRLDKRWLNDDGSTARRDLWLVDPDGAAVRHFSSPTRFCHCRLKEISQGQATAFILGAKMAAPNLRGYRPPHVVKLVVPHSNHVASG